LLICSLLSFFHQSTGINGVTSFSNEIFKDGDEGNSAERRARLGTLLMGISSIIACFSSIWLYKIFPRKFFFITSETVIMSCLFLSGIFALFNIDVGIIVMTMIYVFSFDGGMGPTMWIY